LFLLNAGAIEAAEHAETRTTIFTATDDALGLAHTGTVIGLTRTMFAPEAVTRDHAAASVALQGPRSALALNALQRDVARSFVAARLAELAQGRTLPGTPLALKVLFALDAALTSFARSARAVD